MADTKRGGVQGRRNNCARNALARHLCGACPPWSAGVPHPGAATPHRSECGHSWTPHKTTWGTTHRLAQPTLDIRALRIKWAGKWEPWEPQCNPHTGLVCGLGILVLQRHSLAAPITAAGGTCSTQHCTTISNITSAINLVVVFQQLTTSGISSSTTADGVRCQDRAVCASGRQHQGPCPC